MYDVEMLLKKVSDVKMSTIVSDPRTNASFARIQKSDLLKRYVVNRTSTPENKE